MKYFLPWVLCVSCIANPSVEYETTCPGNGDYEFADSLVEAEGEVGATSAINERKNATNGVNGVPTSGSKDVLSRGYDTDLGNHVVILEWSGRTVLNGPGNDFVIFENAFVVGEEKNFMDLIVVSVSNDLENWSTFPHDYSASDESRYSHNPAHWSGFAGVTPTNYDSNDELCVDPMEEITGGDKFDLDSLDSKDPLKKGFRYLKLQSAPTVENPDTAMDFVRDFISDGFDLDGVYARETEIREN